MLCFPSRYTEGLSLCGCFSFHGGYAVTEKTQLAFGRFIDSSWKMKITDYAPTLMDSTNKKSCLLSIFPASALLCLVFFLGSSFVSTDYNERMTRWTTFDSGLLKMTISDEGCENQNQCRRPGSEPLPKGIIQATSNLEMRPLWGFPKEEGNSKGLLAIAVGINQKETVDRIVRKFPSLNFKVMLFHYDGVVDKWNDLPWSDKAVHVSAAGQTKWWFAKRFLHPDVVYEYDYIFLWDEDLGVENFDPDNYLSIIKKEGLEISQPALDTAKSKVHHQITARSRRTRVHRRYYKYAGGRRCYGNSTAPPCTGWVEMMAPVFSKAAWRCAWYMIQNDLIHAWGLDMKLGYCAQGDRSLKVGVVDSEYIAHLGIATLGASDKNKAAEDARFSVRRQSYIELEIFRKRWEEAVKEDKCWTDPYAVPVKAGSR